MDTPTFQFYSRKEYFADLAERANLLSKGDSITVMTMNFEPQVPGVLALMQALYCAAKRGAEVRLIIDAFTFLLGPDNRPGPMFYGKPLHEAVKPVVFRETYSRLEQLYESGGQYWIINKPARAFTNPVASRSHIKLALINDRVYLGGCNLGDETQLDLMTAWEDATTAAWLRQLTEKITAAGSVKKALQGIDQTHEINDSMTIFVDSGIKRQSLIYKQALDFIDRADKQALITCQYFPGGPTARHLLAAKNRGAKVNILFSGPSVHGQAFGHWLYNLRERSRMPASFFEEELPVGTPKLHAKLIATEHGAMLGSHNYVNIGVNLGTAEIALRVTNPTFAQAAVAKIKSLL
jgi:cardiolipin synthase